MELYLPDKPNLEVFYSVMVHNKYGELMDGEEGESHSFVQAFLIGMLGNLVRLITFTTATTVDVTNASHNIGMPSGANYGDTNPRALGAVNSSTDGIVVGTGNTAVAVTDYVLATQIVHGTGAGQLSHAAQTVDTDITRVSNTCTWNTQRVFTNSSGGDIIVAEMGLYGLYGRVNTANTTDVYCLIRDVLGSTKTITNGSTGTFKYTLQTVS